MENVWRLLRRPRNASRDSSSSNSPAATRRKTFPSGIKLLYDAQGSVVDIVFVHGLTGNLEKTWTAHGAAAPWPQVLLPATLPNARVLTFGYDAYVTDWRGVVSENRIGNHAMNLLTAVATYRENDGTNNRPVIFVCHSLGGLVCEDALVTAAQRPETHLRSLLDSTCGIVFLGTPHRGSGLAKWAEVVARFIGMLKQTNSQILAVLESDSEVLARIQDSFHALIRVRSMDGLRPIEIACFYEELPLPGIGVVVPSQSATLPGYIPIGIRCNHMDIARFQDEHDPGFVAVTGEIRRWMRQISTRGSSGFVSTAIQTPADTSSRIEPLADGGIVAPLDEETFYCPAKYPCPHFTGRKDYLQALVAFFQPRQADEIPSRREFLLYGMGGAGKTQICLKFAEKYSNMFWKVFWVDATNRETIELSLQEIGADPSAQREGVDGSRDSVIRWLSRAKREWLLILDNADGDPAILDKYIPNGGRGNIIITSRNPILLHRIKPEAAREVGAMEKEDAKLLLVRVSHLDEATIEGTLDMQLSSIVDELHSLPLAIDHAGAAILSAVCGPDDYVTTLKTHRKFLLANPNFRGAPGYNETLYSTWSLTTTVLEERARRASSGNSPEATAIQLLNMFAFFHNNSIMEESFQRAAHSSHVGFPLDASTRRELPMALEFLPNRLLQTDVRGTWDYLAFREGIRVLRSFSLIRRDRDQATYSIHPLVHLWSRERLSEIQQRDTCYSVFAILSASIGSGDREGSQDFQYYRRIIPHLLSFRQAMADLKMSEIYFDDGFASFWHAFYEQGLMKEAEYFASELKIRRTRTLGERDQRTLRATEYLAVTLRESGLKGTLEHSNALHESVYRLRVETLGETHPDTLRSKTLLGCTQHYKGNLKKAENLLHSVLQSARIQLGETHSTTLMAAGQLSSVYQKLGDYREAEKLQRQNLEVSQRMFGDQSLQAIAAMATLAVTLTNSGQNRESETLKIQIADLRTQMLGENHPDTIMAHANLAATYCKQKRWKEAEKMAQKVVRTRVVLLGELNRETLRSRVLLANCYLGQDRLHEAEDQCKQAMEGRTTLLGEQHADTLWSMFKLAQIYACQGRVEEATDLWERTMAIARDSEDVVETPENMEQITQDFAKALYRHGQKQKAVLLMEQVLESKRKRLPNEQQHPSILACQDTLEVWNRESFCDG